MSGLRKLLHEHLVLSLAVLVTLVIYSRFLFYGHISWDDPEMVFKNNYVKHFDLKNLFTQHFVGNYIPVTMLAHSLAWAIFGNADWGHHLLNTLLHLMNGILVYQLGRKLFQSPLIYTLGAIVFLLHPLQIESTGWISELKNILSGTFYLAGLLCYVNYIETKRQKDYLLCLLLFVLGCLSKPSAVVFPMALLCIDLIRQNNFSLRSIWSKIPFLAIAVIFGLINIKTQTADQFINHAHEFPFYQRFGFAGFALLKYALLFLFPIELSVIYPYPEAKTVVFITGFSFLAMLGSLIFLFIRRKDLRSLGILLFIIFNLILVLQFLPFGEVLYADRYAYIPLIGLTWLLGAVIAGLKIRPNILFIILASYLAVLSFARGNAWKNAISLYEDILKKYPDQFIALNSAGVENMFLNNDDKALEYLNRAVSAAPKNYKGFYNRGLLYLKNSKPQQAIESFNQSLALYNYTKAYTGRASAYYMLGDIPKAMNDAQFAISKDPNNAKAHFVLGNCYNDLNKLDEAIAEYNKSIAISPEDADFFFKRAIVYGKKQDFRSCRQDLDLCLHLRGDYYEAYYWRAVAKLNLRENPCEDLVVAARHNYEPAVAAYHKYCK